MRGRPVEGHSLLWADQTLWRQGCRGRLGSRGRTGRGIRVPRPERIGQDHDRSMLLGLIRADAGEAWILGAVPCPERLPDVGAIIEEPAFYPWMSGRRNLEMIADSGGRPPVGRDRRGAGAGRYRVRGRRKVKAYSQGMRQRLGLAAACSAGRPRAPRRTGQRMDPAGIHDLRDLLRQSRAGSTVFLSSHLLGEVEHVCDRAPSYRGRLVSLGGIDDLGGARQQIRSPSSGRDRESPVGPRPLDGHRDGEATCSWSRPAVERSIRPSPPPGSSRPRSRRSG